MTDPALPFELGLVSLGNRAFEGNNNCYVLGTEPGATTTLVDTGVAVDATRRQLRAGLDDHPNERFCPSGLPRPVCTTSRGQTGDIGPSAASVQADGNAGLRGSDGEQ